MSRFSRLPSLVVLLVLACGAVGKATDDITINVQPYTVIGAGFGELTPGPHDLSITFQASVSGGYLYAMASDGAGMTLWNYDSAGSSPTRPKLVCYGATEDIMGSIYAGGYYMDPMDWTTGYTFGAAIANATFPCAACGYDPMTYMPACSGPSMWMGCDDSKEGEVEVVIGRTGSVAVTVRHGVAGTLSITGGNDDLELLDPLGNPFTSVHLDGSGTQSVTVILRASDMFSGVVQLTAMFENDNGPLDSQDIIKVIAKDCGKLKLVLADKDAGGGSDTDADDPDDDGDGIPDEDDPDDDNDGIPDGQDPDHVPNRHPCRCKPCVPGGGGGTVGGGGSGSGGGGPTDPDDLRDGKLKIGQGYVLNIVFEGAASGWVLENDPIIKSCSSGTPSGGGSGGSTSLSASARRHRLVPVPDPRSNKARESSSTRNAVTIRKTPRSNSPTTGRTPTPLVRASSTFQTTDEPPGYEPPPPYEPPPYEPPPYEPPTNPPPSGPPSSGNCSSGGIETAPGQSVSIRKIEDNKYLILAVRFGESCIEAEYIDPDTGCQLKTTISVNVEDDRVDTDGDGCPDALDNDDDNDGINDEDDPDDDNDGIEDIDDTDACSYVDIRVDSDNDGIINDFDNSIEAGGAGVVVRTNGNPGSWDSLSRHTPDVQVVRLHFNNKFGKLTLDLDDTVKPYASLWFDPDDLNPIQLPLTLSPSQMPRTVYLVGDCVNQLGAPVSSIVSVEDLLTRDFGERTHRGGVIHLKGEVAAFPQLNATDSANLLVTHPTAVSPTSRTAAHWAAFYGGHNELGQVTRDAVQGCGFQWTIYRDADLVWYQQINGMWDSGTSGQALIDAGYRTTSDSPMPNVYTFAGLCNYGLLVVHSHGGDTILVTVGRKTQAEARAWLDIDDPGFIAGFTSDQNFFVRQELHPTENLITCGVRQKWIRDNWKSARTANKSIGLLISCHSAAKPANEEPLISPGVAGGIVNFGYTQLCGAGDPSNDCNRLLKRMAGIDQNGTLRPAARALGGGHLFANRWKNHNGDVVPEGDPTAERHYFRGMGDGWATLCPASLGHPTFKSHGTVRLFNPVVTKIHSAAIILTDTDLNRLGTSIESLSGATLAIEDISRDGVVIGTLMSARRNQSESAPTYRINWNLFFAAGFDTSLCTGFPNAWTDGDRRSPNNDPAWVLDQLD